MPHLFLVMSTAYHFRSSSEMRRSSIARKIVSGIVVITSCDLLSLSGWHYVVVREVL